MVVETAEIRTAQKNVGVCEQIGKLNRDTVGLAYVVSIEQDNKVTARRLHACVPSGAGACIGLSYRAHQRPVALK